MNESLKKNLSGLSGVAFYVAILVGEVGGIYHSFNMHGDTQGVVSIFVPPFAWFRAIESLGHSVDSEDVSEEEWAKVLEYDIRYCAALITDCTNQTSSPTINLGERVAKFSNKIGQYPGSRKERLKNFAQAYIYYCEALVADLTQHIEMAQKSGSFSEFRKGKVTLARESELMSFPASKDLISMIDSASSSLKKRDISDKEQETIEEMLPKLRLLMRASTTQAYAAYKNIFNEELARSSKK